MREFDLLEQIYRANDQLGHAVSIPPGDDMGAILVGETEVLAAVDQLIAGRHVRWPGTPVSLVGRKAVTRCLSDVAAMAAVPVAALAAGVLPPDFGEERAMELFEIMRAVSAEFNCPLIGGDIAFHQSPEHPLTLSVTVIARPIDAEHAPVRRSGARVGDGVFVTGVLGGSFMPDGSGHHLTFEPRILHAMSLSRSLGTSLHSMIDVSDGLGRDVAHLAEMSEVQITLDAVRFPCRTGCTWKQALGDGEDYELCFTASSGVPREVLGVPITRIGEVTELSASSRVVPQKAVVRVRTPDGHFIDAATFGWEHGS